MNELDKFTNQFKKPKVLIEALPWIQEFKDEIVVVKYGGNAMISSELKHKFAQDIVFMKSIGIKPVVVHGGGPQISKMLDKMGVKSEFVNGLRKTTPEAMEVVRMTLTGKVSRELVGLINHYSTPKAGYAVGMSGEDGAFFRAQKKKEYDKEGNEVDLGLVGEVTDVYPKALLDLLDAGRIPVVTSVAPSVDDPEVVMNINADFAAGAIAEALCARKLVMLTDVEGLYQNYPDPDSVISKIGSVQLREMLPKLESGMIPKMTTCLEAVENGVAEAHIIDGRVPHSLLIEIFTKAGIGTLVRQGDILELARDNFQEEM
ncbi:MAG: acetylglutamate kinase [Candidatus Ancillula sp.]|nr:acetylglutamate kinase [Candidatus Ancillula sp.]